MRNLDDHPYSPDEQRAAEYLVKLTDLGAGDDPIGFLIASHQTIVDERHEVVRRQRNYFDHHPLVWPPRDKQDLVDMLFRVQTGGMSCRKAATLIGDHIRDATNLSQK